MTGITPETGPRSRRSGPDETPPQGVRRDPRYGLVIARPFGIPVYISPYWFLVAGLFVLFYANSLPSLRPPAQPCGTCVAAAFVILLYASVLVHELSHCVVARAFKLTGAAHPAVPARRFLRDRAGAADAGQEFAVSVVGPLISLVLAGVRVRARRKCCIRGGIPHVLIDQLFLANLLVGIFNLLPGLPLDGGRIFRAGVWKVTGQAGHGHRSPPPGRAGCSRCCWWSCRSPARRQAAA